MGSRLRTDESRDAIYLPGGGGQFPTFLPLYQPAKFFPVGKDDSVAPPPSTIHAAALHLAVAPMPCHCSWLLCLPTCLAPGSKQRRASNSSKSGVGYQSCGQAVTLTLVATPGHSLSACGHFWPLLCLLLALALSGCRCWGHS